MYLLYPRSLDFESSYQIKYLNFQKEKAIYIFNKIYYAFI